MKILRESSEDEMILEYLKAESTSGRFSEQLRETLEKLGLEESIILSADLQNTAENAGRKKLLGEFRGYGMGQKMFERFPAVTEWKLCTFSNADLGKIRYIDYSYWNELSAGTHMPFSAAKTIRDGKIVYGVSNDGFLRAAEYIRNGGSFPRLFFLTPDYESFVIVEGHLRMTAYALAPECFDNIEVIVGKCSGEELRKWM